MITDVVVLAAGKGSRMKSEKTKVLNTICGKTLLEYVLDSVPDTKNKILVASDELTVFLENHNSKIDSVVVQKDRLGTGHAVVQSVPFINKEGVTAVLYGDTPFVDFALLEEASVFIKNKEAEVVTFGFLSENKNNSYGKIVPLSTKDFIQKKTSIQDIVDTNGNTKNKENKERTFNLDHFFVKTIIEKGVAGFSDSGDVCNAGMMLISNRILQQLPSTLVKNIEKNEYLLTDIVDICTKLGEKTLCVMCNEKMCQGVNSLEELSLLENTERKKISSLLINNGVDIIDLSTFYPCFDTKIGTKSIVEPMVVFGINVIVGTNTKIGSFSKLENCIIGNNVVIDSHVCIQNGSVIEDNVHILPFTHISNAHCKNNSKIGPFSRLRPNSSVGQDAKVGNFVEMKNAKIESGVKISHHAYIGDADIGTNCNIGAGTIFCNFNGFEKHKITIKDNTFIGANNSLVAPLSIGSGVITAAGSVVKSDLMKDSLFVQKTEAKILKNGAIRYRNIKSAKKR